MDGTDEELAFLLRSDNRTELLEVLAGAGPMDRYEIEGRVDASRRTVTRILDALGERGYLSDRDGAYALSAFGAAVADAYETYRESTALAERYRPLLRHLDSEVLGVDPTLLRGAELTVASDASPYAVLDRVLRLRRGAERTREMVPSIEAKSIEQLADRVEGESAFEFEVILPPSALEEAAEHPEYADAHRRTRDAGAVSLYVYPEPFSFVLGVIDGTGVLGVSVDGLPHAVVESDRGGFVAWIEERLDGFRAEATPFEELDP